MSNLKETVKTEYTDTGRIVTIRSIEYVPYYDTITRKVFVYPKRLNERIEEKKGISVKQEKVIITKTKFIEKKPTYNKWIVLLGFILLVCFVLWFIVRKFTTF